MKRLENIKRIWENLEESYAQKKSSGVVSSRREFLERALDYKSSAPSAVSVKGLLACEVDSYSVREYEQYSELLGVIDKTFVKLHTWEGEISNLEEFVYGTVGSTPNTKNFSAFIEKNYIDVDSALRLNCFTDTVILHEDGTFTPYLVNHEQPGFKAFHSAMDLINFLNMDTNVLMSSDFYKQIYYVMANAMMKKKIVFPTIFISENFFKLDGKQIIVGNMQIPVTKRNLVQLENVSVTTLSQIRIEIPKIKHYSKKITTQGAPLNLYFIGDCYV